MAEISLEQEDKNETTGKTHKEILMMIKEIKVFEEKYEGYDITETSETVEEEFIEFEPVHFEVIEPEPSKTGLNRILSLGKKKKSEQIEELVELEEYLVQFEPVDEKSTEPMVEIRRPTIFKIRFDTEGQLVNLGLKKPKAKPKKEPKSKTKISGKLKKLSFRKKEKTEKPEELETKSEGKLSKLKTGVGKISKIKNVIPRRGKKKAETTEESKEEPETKE